MARLVPGEFVEVRAKMDATTLLPKLLTPEEASELIMVPPEKLEALAKAGFAPCVWIDGKETPFFFKNDICRWVKENLIQIQPGKSFEPAIVRVADPIAANEELPPELIDMAGRLRSYNSTVCVYFLIRDRRVVYVGQTYDLGQRISDHSRTKDFTSVLYLEVPKEDLDRVERGLIRALRPELNQAYVTSRVPSGDAATAETVQ